MWGWEPIVTTEFEYDELGRVAKTVARSEPEFSNHDVELLLGSMLLEADTGSHGQLISESTSVDADPSNRERKYHYEAGLPRRDHAEKARLDAIDERRKKHPDENTNGLIFSVRKVDD